MTKQVTIYMNEKDRERVNELLDILAEEGTIEVLDNRGNPSMAALIRVLVRERLEEKKSNPVKLGVDKRMRIRI